MFIQGNISLRVRKPFGAVVATSGEVLGLISKNCDSEAAFSEARCFGFSPVCSSGRDRTTIQARRASEYVLATAYRASPRRWQGLEVKRTRWRVGLVLPAP